MMLADQRFDILDILPVSGPETTEIARWPASFAAEFKLAGHAIFPKSLIQLRIRAATQYLRSCVPGSGSDRNMN